MFYYDKETISLLIDSVREFLDEIKKHVWFYPPTTKMLSYPMLGKLLYLKMRTFNKRYHGLTGPPLLRKSRRQVDDGIGPILIERDNDDADFPSEIQKTGIEID